MGEPFQRERPRGDFPQDYAAHDIIGYLLDNADQLSRTHTKIGGRHSPSPHELRRKADRGPCDLARRVGDHHHALQPRDRMGRLRDLKLKIMSSMRVGARYLEPVTPPEHAC